MIGVICKKEESKIVEEFFQLFKTPWDFFDSNKKYNVIICTEDDVPDVDAKLLVVYGSKQKHFDYMHGLNIHIQNTGKSLNFDGIEIPIYGTLSTFSDTGFSQLKASSEIVGVKTKELQTKIIRVGYDLFDEVSFLLSAGQPIENADIPTLELHISMLRNWIVGSAIPLVEVPPVPTGYNFIACLTHDVDFVEIKNHKFDHAMWGFVYRALAGSLFNVLKRKISLAHLLQNLKAVISLPCVYLGLCQDFWLQFENYINVEKELRSTYFFIPFKDRTGDKLSMDNSERRATQYDIRDVRHWANLLSKKGYEIGVHGIDAWHDSKKGRLELNEITKVVGTEKAGIRMHWLCFDSNSPKLLEDAGFSYDSTFGYNKAIGFRAGTAQVFRPLGAKRILEVPLHIQDVALFHPSFLNMTDEQADQSCNEIINHVLTHGGVLTILWHLRSVAPERLWGAFYIRLLDQLKKHCVWFATAGQVAKWFKLRRTISFTHESFSDNQLSLRLENSEDVPYHQFALRVYRPASNKTALAREAADYIEIPYSGEKSITIPIQ